MNETLIGYLTQENGRASTNKFHFIVLQTINELWLKYAQYLFKKPEDFGKWLSASSPMLMGESPFNYAMRTGDVTTLEDLVGRMAYGIMA